MCFLALKFTSGLISRSHSRKDRSHSKPVFACIPRDCFDRSIFLHYSPTAMSMTVTLEGTPPPDGDRNIGSVIIVLQAVFVGICTVLVTARLATRYFVVKKLGWEDLFIVLSLVSAVHGHFGQFSKRFPA